MCAAFDSASVEELKQPYDVFHTQGVRLSCSTTRQGAAVMRKHSFYDCFSGVVHSHACMCQTADSMHD